MKNFKKIICGIITTATIANLTAFPAVNAATLSEVEKAVGYDKQHEIDSCTLSTSATLLRRAGYILGDPNWKQITEETVKSAVYWSEYGLSFDFEVHGIRLSHDYLPKNFEAKRNKLISLLEMCPEGIVLYDEDPSPEKYSAHAILLTKYVNGHFFCSDPAAFCPPGEIPIEQSLVDINDADAYWFVKSPWLTLDDEPVQTTTFTTTSATTAVSFTTSETTVTATTYDRINTALNERYVTIAEDVKFRTIPDSNGGYKYHLSQNTIVNTKYMEDDFIFCEFNGDYGFIHKSEISPSN